MIFAELAYRRPYADMHAEVLAAVNEYFAHVESGLQGDSWIWILDGGEKVAIDTFTAMTHQIKAPADGPLVRRVIDVLRRRLDVTVHEEPVLEPHEPA